MPLPSLHIPRYRHRPRGTVTALAALLVLCSCGDDSSLAPVSTPPPSTGSGSAVATSASPETTASVTTTSAGTAPATTATPATPPATAAPSPTESTTQPQATHHGRRLPGSQRRSCRWPVPGPGHEHRRRGVHRGRRSPPVARLRTARVRATIDAVRRRAAHRPHHANTGPSSATSTWPPRGRGCRSSGRTAVTRRSTSRSSRCTCSIGSIDESAPPKRSPRRSTCTSVRWKSRPRETGP